MSANRLTAIILLVILALASFLYFTQAAFGSFGRLTGNIFSAFSLRLPKAVGELAPSAPVSYGASIPSLPVVETLVGVPGDGSVSLAWSVTPRGGVASSYNIYWSLTPANPSPLFLTAVTVPAYVHRGLQNGTTYYYRVAGVDGLGLGAFSNEVAVTPRLSVVPTFSVPSSVPGEVQGLAAIEGEQAVTLVWGAPYSARPISSYEILRGLAPNTEQYVASSPTTYYTDRNLSGGFTYYYRVLAVSDAGRGASSPSVRATARAVAGQTIGGVGNLVASASTNQVSLAWSAPASLVGVTGALSYRIHRGTSFGTVLPFYTTVSAPWFVDQNVSLGTTYYYYIVPLTGAGEGPQSQIAAATVPASAAAVPSTSTGSTIQLPGLIATLSAIQQGTGVRLSWAHPTTGGGSLLSYRIFRGEAGREEVLYTSIIPVTEYLDLNLLHGTTYTYRIAAVNSSGAGELSNRATVAITLPLPSVAPQISAGNQAVVIAWLPSTGTIPVTGYRVMRSVNDASNFAQATSLGSGQFSYTDTGLQNGTTYFYKVIPLTASGDGSSTVVSAAPFSSLTSAAPTTVVQTVVQTPTTGIFIGQVPSLNAASISPSSVTLTWPLPPFGGLPVAYYFIYRGTDSVNLAQIAAPNVNTFTDTGLQTGATYYYQVAAVNTQGTVGARSPALAASTSSASGQAIPVAGAPVQVTGLTASPRDRGAALSWSAPYDGGSAITTYKIYRSTSGVVAEPSATIGATGYTDAGLENGVTYYYWVRATNSRGDGPLSERVAVVPRSSVSLPSLVRNLVASAGDTFANLSWAAPSETGGEAVSYELKRSSSLGATKSIGVGSATSYRDTGLQNGVAYAYEVFAKHSGGSGQVAQTSVTPEYCAERADGVACGTPVASCDAGKPYSTSYSCQNRRCASTVAATGAACTAPAPTSAAGELVCNGNELWVRRVDFGSSNMWYIRTCSQGCANNVCR